MRAQHGWNDPEKMDTRQSTRRLYTALGKRARNSANPPSDLARQPIGAGSGRVKFWFDLVQDELGYPPATLESMWAVPLGRSRFQLDNPAASSQRL
jgi:hypothetical protein